MTLRVSRTSRALVALATAGLVTACSGDDFEPDAAPTPSANAFVGDLPADVDPAAVLEIEDQTSLGANLRVAQVAAPQGGFVVISTRDGRDTYGIGLVEPTETPTQIRVGLGEDIGSGEYELLGRLYSDSNGDGEFGPEDAPLAAQEPTEEGGFAGESAEFTLTLDIAESSPRPTPASS